MGKSTIVTWTLLPVDGGTQLQLEHKGLESEVTPFSQPMRLAQARQDNSMFKATLETQLLPVSPRMPSALGYKQFESCDNITLTFYLSGGWHSPLNSRLQSVLADIAQQSHVEPRFEKLTKREYLAALALQSVLKNSSWIEFSQSAKERGIITNNTLKVADENSKIIAELCVKYADALLARLEEN